MPLCGTAAVAGGIAGIWLAHVLDGTLYPDGAAGIDAGSAGAWLDALGATIVIAVFAIAAMLIPALLARAGNARVRRGRQAAIAAATRAGADLGLIVLAVLAGWQLRRYSAVTASPAGNGATAVTIIDAAGAAYQIPAGTLPADGRPHLLTAPLGGTRAAYPLRLAQITLNCALPAGPAREAPVTLTVSGTRFTGWTVAAASPGLDAALIAHSVFGRYAYPHTAGWRPAADAATLTFTPGYGQAVANPSAPHLVFEPVAGQLTLTAGAIAPAAVPAIATRAFAKANDIGPGAVIQSTIEGVEMPVTIVAETTVGPSRQPRHGARSPKICAPTATAPAARRTRASPRGSSGRSPASCTTTSAAAPSASRRPARTGWP